ncbi:MAG: cobalamin B12-binding domain-containing protein [Pseudomonadota bacterium]
MLDREDFVRSADRLPLLSETLPEVALRDLAMEGLRRVAGLQTDKPDATGDVTIAENVERLARALIARDRSEGSAICEALLAHGLDTEAFYFTYLAGAARCLGEWWKEDRVSFVDVTVGLGRIHDIVHSLEVPGRTQCISSGLRRAVFVTVPGEEHTLGVTLATDFFRRKGWHVLLLTGLDQDALLKRIKASDASIIGVSAGGAYAAPALQRLLGGVRRVRPDLHVFVTGGIVEKARDAVVSARPDEIADTIKQAETILEQHANAPDCAALA